MSDKYLLKDGVPVPVNDLMEWAIGFEIEDRRVALTEFGKIRVSTVFLGLDHSFGRGAPILFETMIFGGKEDGYQQRYTSLEESMLGHERAVELARQSNNRLQWALRRIDAWLKDRLEGLVPTMT